MADAGKSNHDSSGQPKKKSKKTEPKVTTDGNVSQESGAANPRSNECIPVQGQDALSNSLILREIFSNLSYTDALTCCSVSESWRSVADPMMCLYGIIMTAPSGYMMPTIFEVEEVVGCPGTRCNRTVESIQWLTDTLRKSKEKYKIICIDFRIRGPYGDEGGGKMYWSFWSEFGDMVRVFECENGGKTIDSSCSLKKHLNSFYNLEILNCKNLIQSFCRDLEDFIPCKPLPMLTRLHYGSSFPSTFVEWQFSLIQAPSLKEMFNVPLTFRENLSRGLHILSVKSLTDYLALYRFGPDSDLNRILDEFRENIGPLAKLNLKLSLVTLPNFYQIFVKTPDAKTLRALAEIKMQFQRILESSKDTIQLLTVTRAKSDYYFPTEFAMNTVRILKFDDGFFNVEGIRAEPHPFFPQGMDIKQTFPNLEGVVISLKSHFTTDFPIDTFGPAILQTAVRKLKLEGKFRVKEFVTLFPHVTHLEISNERGELKEDLPVIFGGWSHLMKMTAHMQCDYTDAPEYLPEYNLDSALTGIPEDICSVLYREKHSDLSKEMLWEQIRGFQAVNPSLLRLQNLKHLEFVAPLSEENIRARIPYFVTKISVDHALRHMPGLSVYVRTWKGRDVFKELEDVFAPIADFVHLDNTYTPPEIPFL